MIESTSAPTIVVTGYGAWPTAEKNPCIQVIDILKTQNWGNCSLHFLGMPVVSKDLSHEVDAIIQRLQPDAWIGLGVALRYPVIKAENISINKLNLVVPDANGDISGPKTICDTGPLAYEATIPNNRIVEGMKEAGIPAMQSFYAGTHLCNQMLYTCCNVAAKTSISMKSGFIHIPQASENIADDIDRIEPGPSLPLEILVSAVSIAIQHTVEELTVS
ncbi:hypothetical protein [Pseudovibrio sp. Ad26]|uniref:pyroglutamyl-peptidase I family protein n=1 Tax=Pseudovibrio sp. Ad26 TaxID=989410 RepID=UPI0007AE6291|nr:hypothetical protein [Pseudovibrio sp. Ad26]KZL03572.1 Pyrrolidone-carboxylate peptidase [Pseudovibrio sp. Ad26]